MDYHVFSNVLTATFFILPERVGYGLSLALLAVTYGLLIRRHLLTQQLPPSDTPRKIQLSEPQVITIGLVGISFLNALSVVAIIGSLIFTLFSLGSVSNVGRFPGNPTENNRMLRNATGCMFIVAGILVFSLLRSE